jgi:glutamate synthase (NADPH/NADH) small chain
VLDDGQPPITAKGKRVIIIGGGDTGADCLGTATARARPACTSSRSCDRPESEPTTPWPTYPLMFRVSSAHEEGGERVFSVNTEKFLDGKVTGLRPTRS